MSKTIISLTVSLLLTACAIGPDYQRPPVDVPEQWSIKTSDASEVQRVADKWWENFSDPVLNRMVEEALVNNQDINIAIAQLDDAAAQARLARTALLPQLNGAAGGQRGRSSSETSSGNLGEVYTAQAALSWEIDLWGKLRRSNEAARAQYLGSAYNRDATRLLIAAQVAQTYFQMRALDASLEVTRNTQTTREESLSTQEKRFKYGMVSMLEVSQAQSELATAKINAASQALSLKTTENALSVLLGRSPRAFLEAHERGQTLSQMTHVTQIPAGIPSDVLTRRPDVASAEQALVAANARIGVARAAYFPSISLTGHLGSQSLSLSNLFTGPAATWSFVGNLAAPIFNFGATQANVNSANAKQRQALAQYEKSIQNAFKETLDGFASVESTRQQEAAALEQVRATNEALRLANLRYDNGYSSNLEQLDAQRSAYQTQLSLISIRLARLNASVDLYKALGGGWTLPTP